MRHSFVSIFVFSYSITLSWFLSSFNWFRCCFSLIRDIQKLTFLLFLLYCICYFDCFSREWGEAWIAQSICSVGISLCKDSEMPSKRHLKQSYNGFHSFAHLNLQTRTLQDKVRNISILCICLNLLIILTSQCFLLFYTAHPIMIFTIYMYAISNLFSWQTKLIMYRQVIFHLEKQSLTPPQAVKNE